jgi:hypothetical protein
MVGILLQRIHGLEFGVENDIAGLVHATNVDSDLKMSQTRDSAAHALKYALDLQRRSLPFRR